MSVDSTKKTLLNSSSNNNINNKRISFIVLFCLSFVFCTVAVFGRARQSGALEQSAAAMLLHAARRGWARHCVVRRCMLVAATTTPPPTTATTTPPRAATRASFSSTQLSVSHVVGELEPPLTEDTIYERFAQNVAARPDAQCITSVHQGGAGSLTYAELDAVTAQVACGFLDMGLVPGDRVAMWSFNSWQWIAVQIATARVGLVLVNLSPACVCASVTRRAAID